MRSLKSYFAPPSYDATRTGVTSGKKGALEIEDSTVQPSSSPLSDPPPSSNATISTPIPDSSSGPSAQLHESLNRNLSDHVPRPSPREDSFLSTASTGLSSTFDASSQRIIKGGKEVVISSDGEETDELEDLEDPSTLFASSPKPASKTEPAASKPIRSDRAYLAQLTAQKKYKNDINTLVHDAVDDDEIEAKVAKIKASFAQPKKKLATPENAGDSTGINEGMLTSALGDVEEEDGPGLQRLLKAVRRTEALDQDRVWRFFDHDPKISTTLDFPNHCFPPGSNLAALREPESRTRMILSGTLEFAASLGRLPDEFILWLFWSIPHESRDALRKAYYRIIVNVPRKFIQTHIRPNDIDTLFRQLGAKPQALELTTVVVEEPVDQLPYDSRFKARPNLLSILCFIQDASELFSVDVRAHASHILLRISLDNSLAHDYTIHAKLQSALTALLENVSEVDIDDMERQLSTNLYNTVKDAQFQSRMIQHILPTSPWISLLRYRLAVSFLLQDPAPPQRVRRGGNEVDCDYGVVIALSQLLEVALNTSLYDIRYKQADTEKEFNAAIDQLAMQLKKNFSAMKESGASHLKRMLAKGALETLHYRLVYSVRSKPPPKKTPFKSFAKEGGSINNYFNKTSASAGRDPTTMPFR
ncbi:uncharacterized protein N7469_000626 [Penicillium citrinum]|uniref:Uncharacterized protein n=1 Tax=Penicillium citrinum TaxID=5077 RepID=A0A9W9PD39_PENCI|nr:uncharacterized protein N7469_000626 [Penicillium citrinum]KAJ5242299.1 hypothetical protein N7469_000626 [Penicillium citrinum]